MATNLRVPDIAVTSSLDLTHAVKTGDYGTLAEAMGGMNVV